MKRPEVIWEKDIEVRYVETDQMGVVHHSHIPIYFETARTGLFKHFIKSYAAIERRGIFAPIIAYTVEILSPAYYEDILTIRIIPMDYTGVRLTLAYETVRKQNGELIAKGLTTNVFVDEEMKPVNIRSRYPEIYEKIVSVFDEEDSLLGLNEIHI